MLLRLLPGLFPLGVACARTCAAATAAVVALGGTARAVSLYLHILPPPPLFKAAIGASLSVRFLLWRFRRIEKIQSARAASLPCELNRQFRNWPRRARSLLFRLLVMDVPFFLFIDRSRIKMLL